jgi:uncharacterized protein DUF4282
METQASFFPALFDFSFSSFITIKLVRVLFGLGLALGALIALFYLLVAFKIGVTAGLLALILVPLGYLLYAMYLRVVLEVLIVIFKISEGVTEIAARGRTTT